MKQLVGHAEDPQGRDSFETNPQALPEGEDSGFYFDSPQQTGILPMPDVPSETGSYQSTRGSAGSLLPSQGTRSHTNSRHPFEIREGSILGDDLDRYPAAKKKGPRVSYMAIHNPQSGSDSTINNSDNVDLIFSPFERLPNGEFALYPEDKEADDVLHNPDPIADAKDDRKCHRLDNRGRGCLLAFFLLVAGAIVVFIVLPILAYTNTGIHSHQSWSHAHHHTTPANPVGDSHRKDTERLTNYDYGILKALRLSLIDEDTPEDARTHISMDGSEWKLVYSDEFTVEGRTFYPGDDPIWQAVDFHYAATTDLEWYVPDAITTKNGKLVIRLDAFPSHDLYYRSGMLQSWNRLCFTEGYIEIAARLPGSGKIPGLWPGLWTLGNLARPGYLATSEGVWPYSYNECDAGITANQSQADGLSFLPGQKLNKCTCPGEDHPNPGVGRGAPEIDILEGTVTSGTGIIPCGVASQSVQLAPMDVWWYVDYNFVEIYNASITKMNTWTGGPVQQAVSGTTFLNTDWYQRNGLGSFQNYGFEYLNDDNDGYIRWFVGKSPTFTMFRPALGPNGNIGDRLISKEPMSIIINLGISNSWTYIDWLELVFPAIMEIDYVRLYQPKNSVKLTCDPKDFPTREYIKKHINAYSNANLTTWEQAGYKFPKNSLVDGC